MVSFAQFFAVLGALEPTNIAIAIGIVIGAFIIGKGVYYGFKTVGRKVTAKTKTDLDDKLVDALEEPVMAFIIIAGIFVAFGYLNVASTTIVDYFNRIMTVAITIVAAWTVVRLVNVVIDAVVKPLASRTQSDLDDQLVPILHKISTLVIAAFALIMMLGNLGYDVNALLAGVGIGGLAIAFAAQETIANLFGGFSLIADKTFKVGDAIKLESGESGAVHEMTLRSTRIKQWDGTMLTVPNGALAKARIVNFRGPDKNIRRDVPFGVAYGTKADKVKKVALGSIKPMKQVLKDPEPAVLFMEMGDFSLKFVLRFYTKLEDGYMAEREATERVYDALNKAKINIPFPTSTVYLKRK